MKKEKEAGKNETRSEKNRGKKKGKRKARRIVCTAGFPRPGIASRDYQPAQPTKEALIAAPEGAV